MELELGRNHPCFTVYAAMWHSYAGTAYANPHAVTQIGNGLSTTTFVYD